MSLLTFGLVSSQHFRLNDSKHLHSACCLGYPLTPTPFPIPSVLHTPSPLIVHSLSHRLRGFVDLDFDLLASNSFVAFAPLSLFLLFFFCCCLSIDKIFLLSGTVGHNLANIYSRTSQASCWVNLISISN